jgi:asparagine synthase (glutamine-hydrolysing)
MAVSLALSTRRWKACGAPSKTRHACACSAPTSRSAATFLEASTARSVAALGRRFAGERFQTFSLRFADAEYDETPYQRLMAQRIGAEHHEVVVSRADIADAFPHVIRHAERPILRTAPAPLYVLSDLVRRQGIKVVLTGEGADEMFGGYDLFREGKVRRFWARQPGSLRRPRLLERLYPYLARSPVAQQAMARQFFGRNLAGHRDAGFAHDTRWHTTGALKRLLSPAMRTGRDAPAELLADLPSGFAAWTPLAQDQYLECRTLLAGYLLSSQGDRMLMAHSVEGRFPFLDPNVIALANSLPDAYKLRVLDEKHVLKRVAAETCPGRHRRPQEAAVSRPGRGGAHRRSLCERADVGAGPPGKRRFRARSPWSSCCTSAARAATADSPTPTTWRWSACCRRSCCTASSSPASLRYAPI